MRAGNRCPQSCPQNGILGGKESQAQSGFDSSLGFPQTHRHKGSDAGLIQRLSFNFRRHKSEMATMRQVDRGMLAIYVPIPWRYADVQVNQ